MRLYEIYKGEELQIAELILRRRLQMLIHSSLYYDHNTNVISDKQFDTWARELVQLQKAYPDIAKTVDWADAFADWDATTGAFLPLKDPWVVKTAMRFITIGGRHNGKTYLLNTFIKDEPKIVPKKVSGKKRLF